MTNTPDGSPDSDPELETFWRGDAAALEMLYRAHARRLLGTAGAVVGPAEAESVVHETFVELIRNQELRRRFTGGSMEAWLGAIARRKSLEHLRRRGHPPRTDVDRSADASTFDIASEHADPSPEPRLEARDLLMRFLAASVPAAQVDFFRLRFLDGQTQVQVAAALGMPRSTLEGWEHRLSEKLRRFIWENTR
jgi:RNA polymerase sigma factor (sigma-70 family)